MEELKVQLTQTGFNLDRLHKDNKIDDTAYTILKDRNNQALNMCGVGVTLCDFEHHNADIRRAYSCSECGGRKLR